MTKNEAIITGFSNVASRGEGGGYIVLVVFFEKRVITLFFPIQLKPYNIVSWTRTSTLKSYARYAQCNRESGRINDTVRTFSLPFSKSTPIRTDLEDS